MENFTKLFGQYATVKGFAPNSNGQAWNKALAKFNIHSEWFKNVMGYQYFVENVIGE